MLDENDADALGHRGAAVKRRRRLRLARLPDGGEYEIVDDEPGRKLSLRWRGPSRWFERVGEQFSFDADAGEFRVRFGKLLPWWPPDFVVPLASIGQIEIRGGSEASPPIRINVQVQYEDDKGKTWGYFSVCVRALDATAEVTDLAFRVAAIVGLKAYRVLEAPPSGLKLALLRAEAGGDERGPYRSTSPLGDLVRVPPVTAPADYEARAPELPFVRGQQKTGEYLTAVFGDDEALYAASLFSRLLVSRDRGESWVARPVYPRMSIESLAGLPDGRLYAVGRGGVLRSANRGAYWVACASTANVRLSNVWAHPEAGVFAVGEKGAILHSRDGESFVALRSGARESLRAVFGLSASFIVVAGAEGTLLVSRDGGATWRRQERKRSSWLSDAWGSPGEGLYLVGSGGVIVRTRDGGASFVELPSGVDQWLYAIHGNGAGVLYAVGKRGLVVRSEDGGDRWQRLTSGTDEDLHGVCVFASGGAFAVGRNDAMVRYSLQGEGPLGTPG